MCGPLRDDGVSYGDYLEQLTYLIFLKMSDEYDKPPYSRETGIPSGYNWTDMNSQTADQGDGGVYSSGTRQDDRGKLPTEFDTGTCCIIKMCSEGSFSGLGRLVRAFM